MDDSIIIFLFIVSVMFTFSVWFTVENTIQTDISRLKNRISELERELEKTKNTMQKISDVSIRNFELWTLRQ
jgi:hypothetical protein